MDDFEKKISSLTVDQVNAAMKKWIKPEKITMYKPEILIGRKPTTGRFTSNKFLKL
jgi:predicted Zn-dependent peptidase